MWLEGKNIFTTQRKTWIWHDSTDAENNKEILVGGKNKNQCRGIQFDNGIEVEYKIEEKIKNYFIESIEAIKWKK